MAQIKRSAGQSAVAAAAYRSGKKLHSEYYGEDSDYTRKGGIVHAEILLSSQAPPEYTDRQTLWNAVEKAERHPKAQLAYSFDIALQNEFSLDENIALAKQFLLEEFVSRGMIADFAVHLPDPNENGIANPHFHVLCPIRPLEPDGAWGAKQHRVYALDEDGNRIRDKTGSYVFNALPATDWGSPETLEHWREAWARLCNAKFEEKGLPCSIDHRSYQRQGLDILPTVHEGPAVRQMEARGIRTGKGDLNRWIKSANDLLRRMKQKIAELLGWLEEAKAELEEPQSLTLAELLDRYYSVRNAGAYSQKAKIANLKHYAEEFAYLESKGIVTLEQLGTYISGMSSRVHSLNERTRSKAAKMKELKNHIRLAEDFARLKPIVDAIPPKGGWGKKHEKYLAEHDSEIRQFHAVRRKLNSLPIKERTPQGWQAELDKLSREYAAETAELRPIYVELKKLRDIQYHVSVCLHDQQETRTHANPKEELF